MPIDAEFLSKLVCPKSRRPLRVATPEELERLNAAIDAGGMSTVGGNAISEPVEEGLVPEGEMIVYPVRDGVPVLLVEEAISLQGRGS